MMMLRALPLVTAETFRLLRRDRIFLPALGAAILVAAFADIASDWSIEDFTKILYDIGYFGFFLTGSLIAIFWGAKVVSDSRAEGSLEVQLAAPVGRTTWLIGRYLGLCLSLVLMALLLVAIWQACTFLGGFGLMTPPQLSVFGGMILSWLVMASVSLMLATFASLPIALFSTLALWLVGLASTIVASTLGAETPAGVVKGVGLLARVWDLQQFNLIDHALDANLLPEPELLARGAYGAILILIFISVACLIFRRTDVRSVG